MQSHSVERIFLFILRSMLHVWHHQIPSKGMDCWRVVGNKPAGLSMNFVTIGGQSLQLKNAQKCAPKQRATQFCHLGMMAQSSSHGLTNAISMPALNWHQHRQLRLFSQNLIS